tara:strand:+ start:354 stop:566 length:213 start_codon:yes stop_codon:yes gene_type:complete
MTLTKRGNIVFGSLAIFGILGLMGIVGAIETQDTPTCNEYQAEQNWQLAQRNGCPFEDSDGNYLYTWEVK